MSFDFKKIEARALSYEKNGLSFLKLYSLCESKDEKRRNLILASKFLYIPSVFSEWLSLALKQEDLELRKEFCRPVVISRRLQEADPKVIDFLSKCLDLEEHFSNILHILLRLKKADDGLIEKILNYYLKNEDNNKRSQIINGLIRFEINNDKVIDFLKENIEKLNTNELYTVLRVLLKNNKIEESSIKSFLKSWTDYPQEILLRALLDFDSKMYESYIDVFNKNSGHYSERLAFSNIIKKAKDPAAVLKDPLRKKVLEEERIEYLYHLREYLSDQEYQSLIMDLYSNLTDESKKKECLIQISKYAGDNEKLSSFYIKSLNESSKEHEILNLFEGVAVLLNSNSDLLEAACLASAKIQTVKGREYYLKCFRYVQNFSASLVDLYKEALKSKASVNYIISHVSKWPCNELSLSLYEDLLLLPTEEHRIDERDLTLLLNKWKSSGLSKDDKETEIIKYLTSSKFQSIKELSQKWLGREQKFEEADSSVIDLWLKEMREGNIKGVFPLIYSYYKTFPEKVVEILKYSLINLSDARKQESVTNQEIYVFLYQKKMIDAEIAKFAMSQFMKNPTDVGKENFPPIFLCNDSDWKIKQIREVMDKTKGSRRNIRTAAYITNFLIEESILGKDLAALLEEVGGEIQEEVLSFLNTYGLISEKSAPQEPKKVGGFLDE